MSFNPDRPTTPDQPTRNSVPFHDDARAAARAAARARAQARIAESWVAPVNLAVAFAAVAAAAPAPLVVMGRNRVIADSPSAGGAHG